MITLTLARYEVGGRYCIPGHCWVLHLSVTSTGGHGSPPCCGCSNTCLVVFFVPLPHVTLQSLHGSQESTLQSTSKEKLKGEITQHFSPLQSIERPRVGKTLSFQKRKITFTWFSVARLLFFQSWTGRSTVIGLLKNSPASGLGSTSAGCAAVRPRGPIFNFAVN